MHTHYPAKETVIKTLYDKIGGELAGQHDKKWLKNTCAVRMSYALLRSGFNLSRTPDRQACKLGADRKWYWLRVADLRAELCSRFKGFDAELTFDLLDDALMQDAVKLTSLYRERKAKAEDFIRAHLLSKNGIIVFKVKGWGDATGHFTLWDGTARTLAYAPGHDDPESTKFYLWLTQIDTDEDTGVSFLVQVEQIQFWELK